VRRSTEMVKEEKGKKKEREGKKREKNRDYQIQNEKMLNLHSGWCQCVWMSACARVCVRARARVRRDVYACV